MEGLFDALCANGQVTKPAARGQTGDAARELVSLIFDLFGSGFQALCRDLRNFCGTSSRQD